jgi:hypothetical protein
MPRSSSCSRSWSWFRRRPRGSSRFARMEQGRQFSNVRTPTADGTRSLDFSECCIWKFRPKGGWRTRSWVSTLGTAIPERDSALKPKGRQIGVLSNAAVGLNSSAFQRKRSKGTGGPRGQVKPGQWTERGQRGQVKKRSA